MGLVIQNRTANGAEIALTYEGHSPIPPFAGPASVELGDIGRPAVIRFDGAVTPGNLMLELAPLNSRSHSGTRVFPVKDGRTIMPPADAERYRARIYLVQNGAVDVTGVLCNIVENCPITGGLLRIMWEYLDDVTQTEPAPEPGAILPAFRSRAIAAGAWVSSRQIRVPVTGIPSFQAHMSAAAAGLIELYRGNDSESVPLANVGRWVSDVPLVAGEIITLRIRNTAGAAHEFYIDMVVGR